MVRAGVLVATGLCVGPPINVSDPFQHSVFTRYLDNNGPHQHPTCLPHQAVGHAGSRDVTHDGDHGADGVSLFAHTQDKRHDPRLWMSCDKLDKLKSFSSLLQRAPCSVSPAHQVKLAVILLTSADAQLIPSSAFYLASLVQVPFSKNDLSLSISVKQHFSFRLHPWTFPVTAALTSTSRVK